MASQTAGIVVPIAHIYTPYNSKFGVPRQAGLVDTVSRIVFEPQYRTPEALRGIDEFEYLWLIWHFHQADRQQWHPTVRPPRLGGNKRVGVFATRSPFRPNAIGLSAVRLLQVQDEGAAGHVLYVAGADMVSGTPIYDIKPYIPYADSYPTARAGFAQTAPQPLSVTDPKGLLQSLPIALRHGIEQSLAQDPRPSYQANPTRVYAMPYGGYTVRFVCTGAEVQVVDLIAEK